MPHVFENAFIASTQAKNQQTVYSIKQHLSDSLSSQLGPEPLTRREEWRRRRRASFAGAQSRQGSGGAGPSATAPFRSSPSPPAAPSPASSLPAEAWDPKAQHKFSDFVMEGNENVWLSETTEGLMISVQSVWMKDRSEDET